LIVTLRNVAVRRGAADDAFPIFLLYVLKMVWRVCGYCPVHTVDRHRTGDCTLPTVMDVTIAHQSVCQAQHREHSSRPASDQRRFDAA
jgi:hypothetical protein